MNQHIRHRHRIHQPNETRALAELRQRVQQEKAKYESEVVELYRRRLKEVR